MAGDDNHIRPRTPPDGAMGANDSYRRPSVRRSRGGRAVPASVAEAPIGPTHRTRLQPLEPRWVMSTVQVAHAELDNCGGAASAEPVRRCLRAKGRDDTRLAYRVCWRAEPRSGGVRLRHRGPASVGSLQQPWAVAWWGTGFRSRRVAAVGRGRLVPTTGGSRLSWRW